MSRIARRKAKPSVRLWVETLEDRVVPTSPGPTGADITLTTLENQPLILQTANFGFSDPAGYNFLAVRFSVLPTNSVLTDNDAQVNPGAYVPVADISAGDLIYSPNTYGYGAAYDSLKFQVQNDSGIPGRDTDRLPRTMTFNVNWVNQGPSGADNTVPTFENQPYKFGTTDFGYSDPLNGMAFQAVEISSLPTGGQLKDNGAAVALYQYVPVSDIAAGGLIYTPNIYGNGTGYDGFQFQVQNNGGTANNGIDTDPTPRTMTFNVTWVNQAPSFAAADPPATDENADVSIPAWASFNPGAPNESGQTATYYVTNVSNPALFMSGPTVAPL